MILKSEQTDPLGIGIVGHDVVDYVDADGDVITVAPPPGPGHHLKLILARFRLPGKTGCDCNHHAATMDRNGSDWCAANIDTIVGWLRAEAKKRKLPFTAVGAKILVRLAIRRARRDTAKIAADPPAHIESPLDEGPKP